MDMIKRTLVAEHERLEFLPKYIGKDFMKFENLVYSFMTHFCEDYSGGYWEFYKLSNGGLYMSLVSTETYTVLNTMNDFEDEMSADALSIRAIQPELNSIQVVKLLV